jgi:ABC-2 type transport system ATP-binding protein
VSDDDRGTVGHQVLECALHERLGLRIERARGFIQDEYGSDTLRITTEAGAPALEDLAGVDRISDFGRMQELKVEPEYDHQKILEAVMARTRIFSFELTKPTLYDIFIRIAGPEAKENHHA